MILFRASVTGDRKGGSYPQTGDLVRMLATEWTLLKAPNGQVVVLNRATDYVYHLRTGKALPVGLHSFRLPNFTHKALVN